MERKRIFSSRLFFDSVSKYFLLFLTILSGLLLIIIFLGLFIKALPIFKTKSIFDLLFSSVWQPFKKNFGFFPFIVSTFYVTGLSIIFAVPLCLLCAIFLSEYVNKKIQSTLCSLIDLLAGIPSVVYGIWGVLVIVPFIKDYLAPFFNRSAPGYSILAGSIVLSIMIFPIIIQISIEVLKAVPNELREASLALGATKWQTIKFVVLKKALPGFIAAIILGLARAFGETMAVLMVVGNVVGIPKSIFDPGYPLPALIANNYGEILSIPLYDSALLLAGLILLLIVLFFNLLAKVVLFKIGKDFQ
jgi:phosphate transport system permease protein